MFVTSVEYGQVHRFGVQDLGSAGFGGVWISVSVDKPRFKLVQSSLHFGSIQHYLWQNKSEIWYTILSSSHVVY